MDESGNQYVTGFGKSVPRDLNENLSIVSASATCKSNDITANEGVPVPLV
jgi:hypothetical protein